MQEIFMNGTSILQQKFINMKIIKNIIVLLVQRISYKILKSQHYALIQEMIPSLSIFSNNSKILISWFSYKVIPKEEIKKNPNMILVETERGID